jgi:hypothetical protein
MVPAMQRWHADCFRRTPMTSLTDDQIGRVTGGASVCTSVDTALGATAGYFAGRNHTARLAAGSLGRFLARGRATQIEGLTTLAGAVLGATASLLGCRSK